jgi:hypothetical protein
MESTRSLQNIIHGLRMESTWTPHGIHTESAWNPHGLPTESTRSPHGIHTESTRNPHGLRTESTQNPHGLRTESTRSPHGVSTESIWTPWRRVGECKVLPKRDNSKSEPLTNNAGAHLRPPPWPNQQQCESIAYEATCLRPPPWPNQLIQYHKCSLADPVVLR